MEIRNIHKWAKERQTSYVVAKAIHLRHLAHPNKTPEQIWKDPTKEEKAWVVNEIKHQLSINPELALVHRDGWFVWAGGFLRLDDK